MLLSTKLSDDLPGAIQVLEDDLFLAYSEQKNDYDEFCIKIFLIFFNDIYI